MLFKSAFWYCGLVFSVPVVAAEMVVSPWLCQVVSYVEYQQQVEPLTFGVQLYFAWTKLQEAFCLCFVSERVLAAAEGEAVVTWSNLSQSGLEVYIQLCSEP